MSLERFSRRELIREGLVAGEAAALTLLGAHGTLAGNSPLIINKPGDKGPFKLGILGCGNRSKSHISVLNDVSEIDVAALCDIVPHKMDQRAKLIRKGPKPRKYIDMEKMLQQEDLDAIAILTPNHLHKQGTIAALEAGKHVFCEKPMALTVADCNEMIAVSERTRRALQIGTQRRHSNAYKKAVETIRKASVGKILSSDVNSYRGDWRVPEEDEYPPGVEYWRLNQDKCGGVVYEMGAHTIDVNNWIFDSEPLTVVSLQDVNNLALRTRSSTDHGGVLVRYASGAMMNYGGNLYAYGPSGADYFFAVNGTITLTAGELDIHYGQARGFPTQKPLPKPVKMKLPGGGDGTMDQWTYFARVLAGQADPYPDGYMGRQSIQICQGAIASAQQRIVINVNELA
ncbi:MAG: Gfo/Idh/MocA family oxidoreductase [Sedimentisphaerales bacterium]|nr:Gfo/Idh/MocA family oxidoreductase [Sedimentisphaerales bacterium]